MGKWILLYARRKYEIGDVSTIKTIGGPILFSHPVLYNTALLSQYSICCLVDIGAQKTPLSSNKVVVVVEIMRIEYTYSNTPLVLSAAVGLHAIHSYKKRC